MALYKINTERKATPGQAGPTLRFLYHTRAGRLVLKAAIMPVTSRLGGRVLNSRISKVRIPAFIRKSGIDMSQYESCDYRSFNDFFTRKIKSGARPIDMEPTHLISPCDAKLEVFGVDENSHFNIKGCEYTVSELLEDDFLAERYHGGLCLVFRLAVDDYHRYCYFDSGSKGINHYIPGKFHTVQHISLEQCKVFASNSREYTVMNTDNFGTVVQVEVGALMVGRIKNLQGVGSFRRGDEKGMFEFGGSTVILLLEAGRALLAPEILSNSANHLETIVKFGQAIGVKAE